MADYSGFPFAVMSTREIVSLMMESHAIGDGEFVEACRREIARRPEGDLDKAPKTPQEHFYNEEADGNGTLGGRIVCRNCKKEQSVSDAKDMQFGLYTCGYCDGGICDWARAELPKPQGLWRRGA